MKKTVLGLSMAILVSCSSGGGGGGAPRYAYTLPPCASEENGSQESEGSLDDPFESKGKVVLDDSDGPLSDENAVLPVGTMLSVQLNNSCGNPGALASAVREQNPDGSAPFSELRDYDYELTETLTFGELQDLAESDVCVRGVATALEADVESQSDPLEGQQRHLTAIEAFHEIRMASFNATSETVIAIIDTGVDTAHEDLKPVLWVNSDEIAGNGIDDDRNGYVDDVNGYNLAEKRASPSFGKKWGSFGHGTHVAGLAAATSGNNLGVAGVTGRGAKIMGLNVFGDDPGARSSDITNAIRYAADNGADVINLSLSGPGRSAAYESVIKYAIKKGALVVAAAGNQKEDIGRLFRTPASYGREIPGMLTIGSIDSDTFEASSFSNFNPEFVELSAPGSEADPVKRGLLSTYPEGQYLRVQGTSMASPVVAGVAALAIAQLRAKGYDPSPEAIETLLKTATHWLPSLTSKFGGGRVANVRILTGFIEANYSSGARGKDLAVPGSCQ